MNFKRAIIAGVMVWILVMIFYSASYAFPFISNPDLQANIVLCLVLIPCARAGARYYYKYRDHTNGFLLGVVMVVIAMILDGLITVPVFIIPGGGSHLTFFSDPAFWVIALEYLIVVVVYSVLKKDSKPVIARSENSG
jgi:magnesium-transporting ATPase (P-type)